MEVCEILRQSLKTVPVFCVGAVSSFVGPANPTFDVVVSMTIGSVRDAGASLIAGLSCGRAYQEHERTEFLAVGSQRTMKDMRPVGRLPRMLLSRSVSFWRPFLVNRL